MMASQVTSISSAFPRPALPRRRTREATGKLRAWAARKATGRPSLRRREGGPHGVVSCRSWGVLSFSEARETLGSETARVHDAGRRRGGRVAPRGARGKERWGDARRRNYGLRRERRGVASLSSELQTRLTRARLDRRAQHSLRLPVHRR